MKRAWEILGRLLKVVYVLFLLFGIGVVWYIWISYAPYSYETYNYLVQCDNGKRFDPTSKPIDKTNFTEPYTFDDLQLKSECEYGTAYYVGWSSKLAKNYFVTNQAHSHAVRTVNDQIKATLLGVVVYYMLLEIVRRIILYIFLGRNFLTLKKK